VVFVCVFQYLALFVIPGRYLVDIDIERQQKSVRRDKVKFLHARFLTRFAKCYLFDLRLSIGMSTKLEPTTQLTMVGKQTTAAVW